MNLLYKLKFKNEDFEVTEVPLMPTLLDKKRSKYTYFWLKKEGINTFDSSEKVAKFFSVLPIDLGFEGLKDEDAVTHQLFSIKKVLSI